MAPRPALTPPSRRTATRARNPESLVGVETYAAELERCLSDNRDTIWADIPVKNAGSTPSNTSAVKSTSEANGFDGIVATETEGASSAESGANVAKDEWSGSSPKLCS